MRAASHRANSELKGRQDEAPDLVGWSCRGARWTGIKRDQGRTDNLRWLPVYAHGTISNGDGLVARISSDPLGWRIHSGSLPDMTVDADNHIDHHGHIVIESVYLRVS